MESYSTLRLMHLLGMGLLLAGSLGAIVSMRRALRSQDARTIAFARSLSFRLDFYLWLPGLALLVGSGLSFGNFKFVDYESLWLKAGYAGTAILFLLFLRLWQRQLSLSRIALGFAGGGSVPADSIAAERRLLLLRYLQVLILLLVAAMMVFRLP
ncbi:MAG: DUF2269 family protein [Spirochaetales bacterium]|nr:DUF2269 family protein [Spirochaetales bacterium]